MSATTHFMTAEELRDLANEPFRHELIKGELLTMPLPKLQHARVCANLTMLLLQHVRANHLGEVYAEAGFKLESNPDTVLGPDVSFVNEARTEKRGDDYYSGSPDLAVEVLSPGDRIGKIEQKVNLWLQAGARSVWLINPRHRTVEVVSANGERRIFRDTDELADDDTVPGFRVAVSEIFA